ncbi:hypothetical protein QJS04_geneDACA017202 [Acorus gramineus]|uniref:Serine aminopeptidase S33 domain-containing protein n=1 Tax=Acorus gramineus TaxID=55184 RepID=A0AAV9BPA5_ACOGR|nr:hypothetical protein QJS04_geneDACA017202 [Acorus gramineus]
MCTSASATPAPLMLTSGATGRVNALLSVRALRSLALLLRGLVLVLLLPFRWGYVLRTTTTQASVERSAKDEKAGPVVVRVPAAMVPRRGSRDQEVLARRAMAIKRVGEGEGKSVREFSMFVTSRGEALFTQSWAPVSGEINGRYNNFARQLNDNGFKVYGMDWIGHGGSDGLHGYVHSLEYAVNDVKVYVEKVVAVNPGSPCFLFGHSTGGAIILKAALDPKIEALVNGVALTAPAIRVQPSHPIFGVLAPILSFLVPKYQIGAATKQGLPVSRDPEALEAKYSDPLVYTGPIRVRTGSEILRISSHLQQNLHRVSVPFIVLHGTADTVTDSEASQRLYDEASSVEKSIKLYDGFLHDLLFEPEREDITQDIIDWLNSRWPQDLDDLWEEIAQLDVGGVGEYILVWMGNKTG